MRNLLLYYYYYHYYNWYYYLKYLAFKARQLRQARRPEGTLTQPVKKPYGKCCLIRRLFKGVQWGNVNNMR